MSTDHESELEHELRDALGTLSAEQDVPELSQDLQHELKNCVPVAPRRPKRQMAAFVGSSALIAIVLISSFGLRRDLGDLSPLWMTSYAVAWLAFFLCLSAFAFLPRRRTLAPWAKPAAAIAVAAGIVFVLAGLWLSDHGDSSHMYPQTTDGLVEGGMWCLRWGLISAALPIVIALMLLRRTLIGGSYGIAAAIGAAGGCISGFVLHMHCAIADPLHVAAIHGGLVFVCAGASVLILPRTLRLPDAPRGS